AGPRAAWSNATEWMRFSNPGSLNTSAPTAGPPHDNAETTMTSAPEAWTSSGTNGVAYEASTTISAPTRWANSATVATSGRVPTVPDAAVNATSFVRGVTSVSYCHAGSSHVSMSTSPQRTTPPTRRAASTHGIWFVGSSSRDTTTSSPSVHTSPSAKATRRNSTAPLGPNTTPSGSAPVRSATARRAALTMLSARCEAGKTPPGLDTGARMAVATAEATCSG